jgi:hypothetical protein
MPRVPLKSLLARARRSARPVGVRAASGAVRGRALLSYLAAPAAWRETDSRLRGHSNKWESREFAHTLSALGFDVDVIDFDDREFVPGGNYDVVVGIHSELDHLAAAADAGIALMHHTGAYPPFQNAAELRRLEELYERRGIRCSPRRVVEAGEEYARSLARARAGSLLGNEWTLSTYPPEYRGRLTLVPVTGSVLPAVKQMDELVPPEREFLWFFGSGAVHKGLDRALEAFARRPELTLHVVGNIGAEEDFVDAYRRELFELPNIRWHGLLEPDSREFRAIAGRCFCVVAPTCSEGTSPATITMLQLGLYPLISRESGITLPPGAGTYLELCSVDEIEARAAELHACESSRLIEEVAVVQGGMRSAHSHEAFGARLRRYLERAVFG